MAPYLSQLRQGAESTEAWREAKKNILSDKMKYGYWDGDVLVENTAKSRDPKCSVAEIRSLSSLTPQIDFICTPSLLPDLMIHPRPAGGRCLDGVAGYKRCTSHATSSFAVLLAVCQKKGGDTQHALLGWSSLGCS